MKVQIFIDGRISRKEAAKYIGVKPETLSAWNSRGVHDEYFRKIIVANRVFYDFDKIKNFVEKSWADVAA